MFPLNTRVQAADTGFLSPSAQAADTGGDGNGFEVNPTNAFANDATFAQNLNGAEDRHRYLDYGASIPPGSFIHGIEVRLDWRLDSKLGNNSMRVELSWDGGVSWTSAKTDATETTSEHTLVLGGPADSWGRDWAPSELGNANFRVRLTSICTSSSTCVNRDFFLDWVAVKIYYSPVGPNPTLGASCGTDIVLVIDGSGSISAAEYAQMQAALVGFVEAFTGTPTEFALVEFATSAVLRQGFTNDAAAMIAEISEPRVQPGGSYTNWDDGLFDARSLFPHRSNPDLIVFASDGNPNRRGGHTGLGHTGTIQSVSESAAMEWAIQEANAAKGAGVRIVALGIGGGSGESEALDLQNLIAISGPNVADTPGEITIGTDVVLASFDTMADALAELALELCGGTITVHKIVDGDGSLSTVGDQTDGAGWFFAADAGPDDASPPSGLTDSAGLINFDIDLGPDGIATVDILESLESGYSFLSADCTDQEGTAIGTPVTNAVNDIIIGPLDIVTCTFYNRGTVDLYILDIDDDLEGDELIFNLVAENMLPGETQTWTLSLRNDGTLPWDLDPLTDIDTSLSSGWSCEGGPTPEFSVMFTPVSPFPDGVDDHDELIHVEPGDAQDIDAGVTLALSAGNDCQGEAFNLVAVFTATQHLP